MSNFSGVIYSGVSLIANKLIISNYLDIFKISFTRERLGGNSTTSQYKRDITYTSAVSNDPRQINLINLTFDKIVSKNRNLIIDNNSIFLIEVLRLKQELGIPFFLKSTTFMGLAILKNFDADAENALMNVDMTFEEMPIILPSAIDVNGGAVVSTAKLKKVV